MRAPVWARLLLRLLAPRDRADEILGDLEEAHRSHLEKRGWVRAMLRTGLETLDMAVALLMDRVRVFTLLDFKLGFRMLIKYPGLTLVAGVAISFAGEPIYQHYLTVPRIWGLTALEDQQLGGTIMWIPGSMMYLLAAIILISRQVQQSEGATG